MAGEADSKTTIRVDGFTLDGRFYGIPGILQTQLGLHSSHNE